MARTDRRNENSYRSILKGSSAFGGVQAFNILVGILRGKFVAMFLGPAGMGVSALFMTAATTIQQMASLGLNLSIVKEVSASRESLTRSANALAVARRLIILSSLLGALATFLLAPWLSEWTFGDSGHTGGFRLLSLAVGLSIAAAGQLSVLQGLHQVKRLSLSSLVGGLTGLLVGVPLYYFFGTGGIVPAMIAMGLSMFLFYRFSLSRSVAVRPRAFDWGEHGSMVRRLVAMGLVLMAGSLLGSATNYLINLFVRSYGSMDNVGLYQAANSVTNQYVGMVFSAMSLDFFPRLTAIASDNRKMRDVVNRQTEIVALVITPLATGLILSAPLVIMILMTEKFMAVMPLMRWMGLGVLLRGIIYPMGYISFAKENKRLFFWLEGVTGNLLNLALSCGLYYTFGLDGLGMALVASCGVTFVIYYVTNRRLYGFSYDRRTALAAATAVAVGAASFAASLIPDAVVAYSAMGVIFLATTVVSFMRLRKAWRRDR